MTRNRARNDRWQLLALLGRSVLSAPRPVHRRTADARASMSAYAAIVRLHQSATKEALN